MKKYLFIFIIFTLVLLPGCFKKNSQLDNNSKQQPFTENSNTSSQFDNSKQGVNDEQQTPPTDPLLTEEKPPQMIGGETDSYGCLTAAGYTWCASKKICLKNWEQECDPGAQTPITEDDSDKAIKIAKEYFDQNEEHKNLIVLNVSQDNCIGCWSVEFQYEKEVEDGAELVSTTVILENWQVK